MVRRRLLLQEVKDDDFNFDSGGGEIITLLPSGFQRVEYIQTNESVSFNMNIKFPRGRLTDPVILYLDIQATAHAYSSAIIFNINSQRNTSYSIDHCDSGYGFRSGNRIIPENGELERVKINVEFNGTKNTMSIGSNTIEQEVTQNIGWLDNTWLLGEDGLFSYRGKIYEVKFNYQDDKRHFIPCYCTEEVVDSANAVKPAGTIGLYDIENNKFYTSKTGVLTKGDDK